MRRGPFARMRQARADERELGTGLWRRDHDRFVRALDRCWQVLQEAEARSELDAVKHVGAGEFADCPQCGRLLVP